MGDGMTVYCDGRKPGKCTRSPQGSYAEALKKFPPVKQARRFPRFVFFCMEARPWTLWDADDGR